MTVYAASGLCGLVSCRLRSQDSPFRVFPFQKAALLSKPLLPCGQALARAFALDSSRHSPVSVSSVLLQSRPRLVPLEKGLFVYRFPDAVVLQVSRPLALPLSLALSPVAPLLRLSSRTPTESGMAWDRAVPGFWPGARSAPPLRSFAPSGSPFSPPSGCS